jgi:hypothetical protein
VPEGIIILEDRSVKIGGLPARWLIKRIAPRSKFAQDFYLIVEDIFLDMDDRYYLISLDVPESERDGEFAKGFGHLVSSIQIIP